MKIYNKKKLVILGSTGSIGTSCLRLFQEASELSDRFEIYALTAHNNIKLLNEQILKFKPKIVIITNHDQYNVFLKQFILVENITILKGSKALIDVVQNESVDIILNALLGINGLLPTYHAILASKFIAIANKESIVIAGYLFKKLLLKYPKSKLIPVDSEHSALFFLLECFTKENEKSSSNIIEKIILTASGGPLRLWDKKQLAQAKIKDVLNHPNWNMGKKITVDSASLMNKGFELIEAYHLFNFDPQKIEIVIHPQSYIHGFVQTNNFAYYAQVSYPDMILPIYNAITYPNHHVPHPLFAKKEWHIFQFPSFQFYQVDHEKYPLVNLCYEILKMEASYAVVLNASNDVAVEAFLKEEILFIDIPHIIQDNLNKHIPISNLNIHAVIALDEEVRFKLKEKYKI